MKTPTIRAAFLLAVLAACSREEAPPAPESSHASTARGEVGTVRAKPEMLPPEKRRVLELEGGVRVEVLAEGQGSIVGPGDEVAFSMTLSYVPTPPDPAAEAAPVEAVEDAQAEKPKSKSKSKRNADKKSADAPTETAESDAASDAKPVEITEVPAEGSATLPATTDEKSKSDVAKTETDTAKIEDAVPATDGAGVEAPGAEKVDVAQSEPVAIDPTQVKPVDSATTANATTTATAGTDANATTDAAPSASDSQSTTASDASAAEPIATAPPPAQLAAPLEPVIVLSTKTLGMPIRGRVGAEGALLPGLSRAFIGLRVGTVAEIMIPPESAYGAGGLPSAGIPPGTLLLAHIEIREVRR